MKPLKNSLVFILSATFSIASFAQSSVTGVDSSNTIELEPVTTPPPSYTAAQLLPAYKVALKKGMFEISSGLGHIDQTKELNAGQSNYVKRTPQTDFIPFQIAYGLTDNMNITIAGKLIRETDKGANSSMEGTSEPQFTLAHVFRNANSAVQLSGTYTPDIGPRTITYNGASRTEGNTLEGGASGELGAGYFYRWDPLIFGGEASYLYKDTRIANSKSVQLFKMASDMPSQIRSEGGAEKTLRGIVEFTSAFRFGMTFGRTWVEQQEDLMAYQTTPTYLNSYYRDFIGGYGRLQIHPRLSLIPMLSYSEASDTASFMSQNGEKVTTQVNLRFRF